MVTVTRLCAMSLRGSVLEILAVKLQGDTRDSIHGNDQMREVQGNYLALRVFSTEYGRCF